MLLAFFANAATASTEQASAGIGAGAFVEMLLWLALIVAFIIGCAWLLKKLGGGVVANAGAIRVRSVASLGSREKIALVEVGGKQILLGVCPSQINQLYVFDEDILAKQEADSAIKTSENSAFATKLQSILGKGEQP
ncbi:MAG: flagellar biosynthetic protein FliO [Pseudohongiellaceae bacterium]|nr:flagellar biosynthetic protein FliO [Pseudohongiellaceae bacterium]